MTSCRVLAWCSVVLASIDDLMAAPCSFRMKQPRTDLVPHRLANLSSSSEVMAGLFKRAWRNFHYAYLEIRWKNPAVDPVPVTVVVWKERLGVSFYELFRTLIRSTGNLSRRSKSFGKLWTYHHFILEHIIVFTVFCNKHVFSKWHFQGLRWGRGALDSMLFLVLSKRYLVHFWFIVNCFR